MNNSIKTNYHTIIIGGGAAGFFTAINLAQRLPGLKIAILERGKEVLNKVRISGGGRCNVTHAQFDPRPLTTNYPRGERELLGPFHSFMTGDTMAWFENHGVPLKIEEDGRIFPVSNSSQSIIDCFITLALKHNIKILTSHNVTNFLYDKHWHINTKETNFICENLVITAGSSTKIWSLLETLNHTIVPSVPSLFTFNVVENDITSLAGIAIDSRIEIPQLKLESDGATLITHWGFSGPAILKLSAWGAIGLSNCDYKFDLIINWLHHIDTNSALEILKAHRSSSKKTVINDKFFDLPKRLWHYIVDSAQLHDKKWADCSNKDLNKLLQLLTASVFKIDGKSTFKEEFVTAGGVDLKEINFKDYSSKKQPHLYLAGEVLNVDAITGGFNFQNAWTGGWIISQNIKK